MRLLNTLRSAFRALTMVGLAAHVSADTGCFDITYLPAATHSGGISCTCDVDPLVSAKLGTGPNSVNVQTGGPRRSGAVNCFTTTEVTEGAANVSSPGGWIVQAIAVKSKVTYRACDTSGCRSILFGLIKWGGATCPETGNETIMKSSWKVVGPCDRDPEEDGS